MAGSDMLEPVVERAEERPLAEAERVLRGAVAVADWGESGR